METEIEQFTKFTIADARYVPKTVLYSFFIRYTYLIICLLYRKLIDIFPNTFYNYALKFPNQISEYPC